MPWLLISILPWFTAFNVSAEDNGLLAQWLHTHSHDLSFCLPDSAACMTAHSRGLGRSCCNCCINPFPSPFIVAHHYRPVRHGCALRRG
jgi:hypothetical protein